MKRSSGTPVNLLPLLDVLLCTMGTLIVVLGVLNRMARTHTVSQQREDAAIAKEQITLRVDQLTTAREKTIADLDAARRELSAIEQHSRELEDKLHGLQSASKQLADKDADDQRDALRRELGELNADRAKLDKDLQTARNASVQRKLVFSIVPFDGVYKTNRRPIYIECRNDVVILQPEGIVFTPTDFSGPPGPGNPLASALRAAQDYWSSVPPPANDIPNEPYPLLLVRPDGIIAYYLVRDAMSSWNTEFGYELVSGDSKFDFPIAPEPRLAEMEKRAVDEARERLQWLAQVSPEAFQRKQKVQYRVSAMRGGLVRDGAPSLGNDPFANDPLGGFGRSPGSGGALANGDPGAEAGNGNGGYGVSQNGNGTTPNGSPYGGGNSAIGNGGYGGNPALGNGGSGALANGGLGGDAALGGGAYANGGLNGDGSGGDRNGGDQNNGGQFNGGSQSHGGFQNGGSGYMTGAVSGQSGTGSAAGGADPSGLGPRYSQSGNGTFQMASGGLGETTSGNAGGPQLNGPQGSGPQGSGQMSGGVAGAQTGTAGGGGSNSALSGGTPGGSATTFGDLAARNGMTANGAMSGGGGSAAGGQSTSADGTSGGSGTSAGSASGQSGSGGSGDPSQMASGMPSPSLDFTNKPPPSNSRSLSKQRGRNWAIQNNATASVPITRPIRVECWNDRLVLIPDGRDEQPQVIPVTDHTDEAVDQLVAAVRVHTQSWGLAGRGMYWKPQLMLDVKPTAESRASDLQVLLADSGLDVKRK